MDSPHTVVEVTRLPSCDFCTERAMVDGKTRMRPWAYMCAFHFGKYGVGLGVGRGQKLVLVERSRP